jgi:uncharacterized membrane protein
VKNKIAIVLIFIIFVIGIISYTILPDKVPLQWGISGQVNRYGGKLEASAMIPLISIILFISNTYKGKATDNWKSILILVLLMIAQLIVLGLAYFL